MNTNNKIFHDVGLTIKLWKNMTHDERIAFVTCWNHLDSVEKAGLDASAVTIRGRTSFVSNWIESNAPFASFHVVDVIGRSWLFATSSGPCSVDEDVRDIMIPSIAPQNVECHWYDMELVSAILNS